MTKPTPGPWSLHRWTYSDPDGHVWKDGRLIASCMGYSSNIEEVEKFANARLIAAAPDLLKAAKAALAVAESDGIDDDWVAVNLLQTAIAKAEGRE